MESTPDCNRQCGYPFPSYDCGNQSSDRLWRHGIVDLHRCGGGILSDFECGGAR